MACKTIFYAITGGTVRSFSYHGTNEDFEPMKVNKGDTVVLDCEPFVSRNFIGTVLYRWIVDGNIVDGQGMATLTINKANITSEGTYECLIRGRQTKGVVMERQSRKLVVRG